MRHEEEYKGHQIVVDTIKRGKGYAWSYVIDGERLREGQDRPLNNEQLMLDEAIREAKHEIDRMGA
jgi:hypothetical protein